MRCLHCNARATVAVVLTNHPGNGAFYVCATHVEPQKRNLDAIGMTDHYGPIHTADFPVKAVA